eukprot:PhM_4_TR3160/c0_g1_i2/m.62721
MGVLTSVNCLLLTFGPLWAIIASRKLTTSSLTLGAVLHIITQVARLIILAALPMHLLGPVSAATVDLISTVLLVIDGLVMHTAFTTFQRSVAVHTDDAREAAIIVSSGWSLAEAITTRVAPIYVRASDISFSYDLYVASLEINSHYVRNFVLAAICSAMTRGRGRSAVSVRSFGAVVFSVCLLGLWYGRHFVFPIMPYGDVVSLGADAAAMLVIYIMCVRF